MANAYPAAASPLLGAGIAGYGAYGQQQQYANEEAHALSPTRSSFHPAGPSTVSEGSSYGASPYAPPIGRGPSPGPSVARTNTSNSSGGVGAGGGAYYNNPRSAKEMEALGITGGVHVMNPSHDGEYSQHAQGQGLGGQGMHAGEWVKRRIRRTLLVDLLLRTLLVQVGDLGRSLFIGMEGGCLLLGRRRRNLWLRRRFRLLMIVCRRRRGCSFGWALGGGVVSFFSSCLMGGRADFEIGGGRNEKAPLTIDERTTISNCMTCPTTN